MHRIIIVALVGCGYCSQSLRADEPAEFGMIRGRVVFDGDIPIRRMLVEKKRSPIDSAVCAKDAGIPDESLIVSDSNRGVANVFVYMPKATSIHSTLRKPAKRELTCRFRECRNCPSCVNCTNRSEYSAPASR